MRISDNPDDVLLIENYVRSEDGEVLARYRICKDEKSNKYGILDCDANKLIIKCVFDYICWDSWDYVRFIHNGRVAVYRADMLTELGNSLY